MLTATLLIAVLILVYLLLKFNSLWLYACLDRARRNDRNALPPAYERPRYFKLDKAGKIDTSVRWPGWDGWYFFVYLDDDQLPTRMIRASLMTGLYGLDGVDNYRKLAHAGLSSFAAGEYLSLVLTRDAEGSPGSHLSQYYLPKKTTVHMKHTTLDVAMLETQTQDDARTKLYGRVRGSWPNYRLEFNNTDAGIHLRLDYTGERILWWADAPGIFTYFVALGTFEGTVVYGREPAANGNQPEAGRPLRGVGGFEHGFARKPFNFDTLWLPVRLLKHIIPSLQPIRYHYELFLTSDGLQGGFMYARGFTIDFRNRGGLYVEDGYREIRGVKIEYLDHPPPDVGPKDGPGQPAKFYRRWKVRAMTDQGVLEYTGIRDWPAAPVTGHIMYYGFRFEGTYQGKRIVGRGYGEYLRI